ncbi:cell envelope biogenesis protein OmpA [Flavobacterium columnare NBRC 100251 = ATCC 23463]|uniref:OmpA family outer membrane protein n=2 Tax=Flavobacterium columnare TaxID=996 RepID=G8X7D8_FLACA|nr:OmpA family outer membrane protein [Flavobacterium columnare ATCC 49512]MBF6653370.1 cell envelope biogenesis protein OmpA [Flavobacterium columnare]PDS22335.1 cell envelope biogenesis protein OmpA [Flavobacterium columnare NBRC 100251 = ATCC 23463]MBF6655400.1 cell envelope biogenesis protein OmpA [Flavobacterium columnare]MBF6656835.1 cell envelope biogenesis protein OmpA [Flavobacterium columnare]
MFFLNLKFFGQEQFSIYFKSDKYDLAPSEKGVLEKWIQENKKSKILTLKGYTDEDGTYQYNDSLAKKRTETVFNLIKGKIVIREDFKKINFGELHKQSNIKAENRKVVLFFLKEKDLYKEKEIIASKIPTQLINESIVFPKTIVLNNPDGSETEIDLDVQFMKKLYESKVGEKLKIENLNFVLNTFAITKESRGKLYELWLVMQQNPRLKIQIQGHVCCVAKDRQDLSTQRAKAVYKFLEFKNIDKTRMSYKGFGSTQPLYDLPEKNEEERAANRRVEIEVVEN